MGDNDAKKRAADYHGRDAYPSSEAHKRLSESGFRIREQRSPYPVKPVDVPGLGRALKESRK